MRAFGHSHGESDPVSYKCTCEAEQDGGSVLLFYRYWTNDPKLPEEHFSHTSRPEELASWHKALTEKHKLGGKIRIAKEGYNITVAGTSEEIASYISECCTHWSFSGLDFNTKKARSAFFKPTEGCACVFGQVCSIRVAAEITPMGVESYTPSDWNTIESLSPAEFHKRCHEENTTLIDVRNHYESNIGYFISPKSGSPTLRPPIRRFSQFPQYVKQHMQQKIDEEDEGMRQIMTYCTGGIRCEKAVRWMQENTPQNLKTKTTTLNGGITAYLTWMDEEIKAGRKNPEDSLFKGRNYVFDARGSVGLSEETEPVAVCHVCKEPSDRLSKCRSKRCHLVLVVCLECDQGDPRCCENCRDLGDEVSAILQEKPGPRPMCNCEYDRERELWGGERVKPAKKPRSRKAKHKELGSVEKVDIQIKLIE